jgi:hypoxanthine phosphoribosyltransferase
MSVSSYGSRTTSSGIVRIIKDLEDPVDGEDVIIVEDIIDSGRTLSFLKELFRSRGAASIRVCTLLDKPSSRAPEINIHVDYKGFEVPDQFVVGWGMDYDQRYRNLHYIGVITWLDE